MSHSCRFVLAFCAFITLVMTDVSAGTFQALGIATGADTSLANGVSEDGSVVVGTNNKTSQTPWRGFRWTQAGGQQLIVHPNGSLSNAIDVSADGNVVVGGANGSDTPYGEAYRWTTSGGMALLGMIPGGFFNGANGVSDDGATVVGWGANSNWIEGYRWTNATGLVQQGFLPGGQYTYVGSHPGSGGLSGDGVFMVGGAMNSSGNSEAYRDTASGELVGLGHLAGGANSGAAAASYDGSVVVGESQSTLGPQAMRWTSSGQMVGLGDLDGGMFESRASSVSSDGSIVVGRGSTDAGFEAFIWDATNGMRKLSIVLTNDFGLDLTGWTLSEATAISGNGLVVVGYGTNPQGQQEAFRASLETNPIPEPTAALLVGGAALIAMRRQRVGAASC